MRDQRLGVTVMMSVFDAVSSYLALKSLLPGRGGNARTEYQSEARAAGEGDPGFAGSG
jgi:hypothetical protein